jgi:hypothetical protein
MHVLSLQGLDTATSPAQRALGIHSSSLSIVCCREV